MYLSIDVWIYKHIYTYIYTTIRQPTHLVWSQT